MRSLPKVRAALLHFAARALPVLLCAPVLVGFSGCGTPGAPQPPSLRLPEPVTDLTAVRNGNTVTLHWTMPRKTTDHLLIASQIRGPVPVRICRRETVTGVCQPAGETAFGPLAAGQFQESLPASLTTGEPRQLLYFVELRNKLGQSGKSAGLSNSAVVAAGAAPAPITDLTAQVRADGVALHWSGITNQSAAVRLHRRLLTPQPKEKKHESGMISAPAEPILRDLLVEPAPAQRNAALDNTARFSQSYEYTAQRIDRVTADGKTLELAGEISAPVKVEVIDTFPPAIPTGLAAVASAEEKTIDLSWQPDTESDLAGYIVYRISVGQDSPAANNWLRISGLKPIVGPAYRDTTAQAGHAYRYAVTAIDQTGHESARSTETQESLPNP